MKRILTALVLVLLPLAILGVTTGPRSGLHFLTTRHDVTVLPSSNTTFFGENGTAQNEFIGLMRINMAVIAAFGDGPVEMEMLMDDTPAGECAPRGGGTEANDTSVVRIGTNSYQMTFDSSVDAAEGLDCTVDWANTSGLVSFGFWLRSSVTFAAGDLEIILDDGGGAEATEDIAVAYTIPNEWVWIEVDITDDCSATCNGTDGIFIQTTAQAPTTFNDAVLNIDAGALWLLACEEVIGTGFDVPVDGIFTMTTVLDVETGTNAAENRVEWTDYFINYQAGNDVVCAILDLSARTALMLHAYQ